VSGDPEEPAEALTKVAFITLGCAKNQVDSEVMLGLLSSAGFQPVADLNQAEVAVVNTCGFLASATDESIDAILDVSQYKKKGCLKKLVVAGCLVPRYGAGLKEALPEVDLFLPPSKSAEIVSALSAGLRLEREVPIKSFLYDHTTPREIPAGAFSAYVKIADGCGRGCAFCIIPKLRGPFQSRSLDSVVQEVRNLGARGVREVNLVAQDLTAYGEDFGGPGLSDLLYALDQSAAVPWIRALYAYPTGVNERLIDLMVELPRVCEYLDLPLQHSSERILSAMKRPLARFAPRRLVEWIRRRQPGLFLRTTFITGFPGEREDDFQDLLDFVEEGHFASVGVFPYSHEEGSTAYSLKDDVPDQVKAERREKLMLAQQAVNEKRLEGYFGKRLEVLFEGPHAESELLLSGRARFQAPEVDGCVIINDSEVNLGNTQPGAIVQVEITEACGYDLLGRVVAL
jgi:ribosomal protein S12 methylthiotransferase